MRGFSIWTCQCPAGAADEIEVRQEQKVVPSSMSRTKRSFSDYLSSTSARMRANGRGFELLLQSDQGACRKELNSPQG